MRRFTRQMSVFCLVAALIVVPMASSSAFAADDDTTPSASAMGADLVGVRPLGIVSTVFGLAGYVISLPFSIPGGNNDAVWEKCVVEPARYTFKRPLGEF